MSMPVGGANQLEGTTTDGPKCDLVTVEGHSTSPHNPGTTYVFASNCNGRELVMDDPDDYSPNLPGETDLLSNATRIVLQPDEDPRPWLGPVASGTRQLLTFMHEATHNWCFSSPVVQAQLHVATRAAINSQAWTALSDPDDAVDQNSPAAALGVGGRILRALHGDPRPQLGKRLQQVRDGLSAAIHDDLIRLEVMEALLRPLAEGLALFAEYDSVTRLGSKAASPLPTSVAFNFAGYDRLKEAAVGGVESLSRSAL